jgi:hypothetical protein
MRLIRSISCIGLLAVSAFASDGIVPITDTLRNGSPVRNSGHVTFAEETSEKSVLTSYSQDWTVRNISSKAIVTLIESLTLEFPDGYRSGGIEQYDLFFHPGLMKPGDELSFTRPASGVQRVQKHNSSSGEPKCVVSVLWVQFADGSTFGDAKYAASLLSERRQTLEGLTRLGDIYANEGAKAFLKEIQPEDRSGTSALDMYLIQLKVNYKQTGNTQEAYNKLKSWLDAAQSRRLLLD